MTEGPTGRRRLGLRLYVILSEPTEKASGRDAVRDEHFAYIYRLEREGVLFAAGPEVDEADRPKGPGIIIIRADSFEAARAIAEAEPFHKGGYRRNEVRTWRVSEGSLTLSLRFSDQTVRIA